MARRIPALALLASVLVLSGCVHESPFTGDSGYFFQAMGRDSEIVLTADTGRVKEEMPSMLATGSSVMDELFDRSTRVSVAFYKDVYGGEADYPADLADFDYYGGLEGNYGSFTINTALAWSSQFHKEKVDGVKYYTDDGHTIELAVPESGLLLFASRDYVEAYRRTVEERFVLIPDDTARTVKMSDAILYVNAGEDGGYVLNADITMQSEDLARTLLQLLRQQVLAELRRQGVRPDYQALSQQYLSEGRLVMIRDFPLSEEQMNGLSSQITSISGGII